MNNWPKVSMIDMQSYSKLTVATVDLLVYTHVLTTLLLYVEARVFVKLYIRHLGALTGSFIGEMNSTTETDRNMGDGNRRITQECDR